MHHSYKKDLIIFLGVLSLCALARCHTLRKEAQEQYEEYHEMMKCDTLFGK